MIEPISGSDYNNYLLAGKLLDASVLRQQAIASNIANAETPGYHRLDISKDFASQLRTSMQSGDLQQVAQMQPKIVEDSHARTMRPDGNSVEMENELLEMNRNSVEYNFLTEVISGNLKQLKTAISGTVTS